GTQMHCSRQVSPFSSQSGSPHLSPLRPPTIVLASSPGESLTFPIGGRRAVHSCLVVLAVALAACGGGPRSLAFAPDPVSETALPVAAPLAAARPNGTAHSATVTPRHRKASTTVATPRSKPAGSARARGSAPARAPSAPALTPATSAHA